MNILAAGLCVLLFSLTVPFTRIAALEIPPEAIIFLRLIGASLVCGVFVMMDRWVPPRKAWNGILATSLGSVIGFSSFMAYAMKEVPGGHAAVALAAMPIVTASYAVLRDGMHPGNKFWFFAISGSLLSFAFFFTMNVGHLGFGDILLVMAVFSSAFGYVEGARLSRLYSGTRVMSWAIIATLPLALPLATYYFSHSNFEVNQVSLNVWLAVAYLALVSQSTGMYLWFKVLAIGPMEKIALVQLLQPFLTLLASILLLGEVVSNLTWIIATLVAGCVFGANQQKKRAMN
jgi:drug/metabolite transporter (DMT)-like permease